MIRVRCASASCTASMVLPSAVSIEWRARMLRHAGWTTRIADGLLSAHCRCCTKERP